MKYDERTFLRVDQHIKQKSAELFDKMGVTVSSAIRLFLHQVVEDGEFPFKPSRKLINELGIKWGEK